MNTIGDLPIGLRLMASVKRFRVRRLIRLLVSIAATVIMVTRAAAQEIANTEAEVIAALGTPTAMRDTGGRKICFFRNGARVVFEKGVAVEVSAGSFTAEHLPRAETPAAREMPRAAPPRAVDGVSPARSSVSARPLEPQIASEGRIFESLLKSGVGGDILVLGGFVTILVCQLVMLFAAFRKSVIWGLAVLFLPIANLIFVMCYWSDVRKPFLILYLVGVPAIFIGAAFQH